VRILINDIKTVKQQYINIFYEFGYEKNELIFCTSFEESKTFILNYLESKKLHIDLIITNDTSDTENDKLNASGLCYFIKSLTTSYSKNNFRISSIPIILYSKHETKSDSYPTQFDSIVQKDQSDNHKYFISECEKLIKEWRKALFSDLEQLGLKIDRLSNFHKSQYYKNFYKSNIERNSEAYFTLKTKIVSVGFIKYPAPLNYDWILLNQKFLEEAIERYINTYMHHVKYDRKNNERTILHDFFNNNKVILLRDAYNDLEYEMNLFDKDAKTSEECDYILKTEFPEFHKTTFFEVKKEDVTFYVKKKTKRPQISYNFLSHLEQIWRYKEYSQDLENWEEMSEKIGYQTQNFDYVLLAGRLEEKMEMKEKFEKDIDRMFNQINVITYEELEEVNINFYEKFNRLKIE
jgi:hypothetical protein